MVSPGASVVGDSDVVVVRAFGLDRIGHRDFRCVGRARVETDRRLRDELLWRRREVARVRRVQGGVGGHLPQRVHPRTPLVLVREGIDMVEAHAVVQRELRREPPFVLHVEARQVAGLARIVDDVLGDIAGGDAHVVGRKHADRVVAAGELARVRSRRSAACAPRCSDTRHRTESRPRSWSATCRRIRRGRSGPRRWGPACNGPLSTDRTARPGNRSARRSAGTRRPHIDSARAGSRRVAPTAAR